VGYQTLWWGTWKDCYLPGQYCVGVRWVTGEEKERSRCICCQGCSINQFHKHHTRGISEAWSTGSIYWQKPRACAILRFQTCILRNGWMETRSLPADMNAQQQAEIFENVKSQKRWRTFQWGNDAARLLTRLTRNTCIQEQQLGKIRD